MANSFFDKFQSEKPKDYSSLFQQKSEPEKPLPIDGREILTCEWFPQYEQFDYPKEFVSLIDSINSGWQNRKSYIPFELYKAQAQYWIDENIEITDFDTEEEQRNFLEEEIQRCKDNSLYFCNKYGWIKEDKAAGGKLKYNAWEAQKLLLFLFDCGHSMMIGKARQIGFTTVMCLAGMKKVNFLKSYFIKFITHSVDKGVEIFRDKVKWAYTKVPEYLAQAVENWTKDTMSFDKKGDRKGREDGGSSRFQVDAPSISAINGGSPSAVLVDEIGLFEIFGDMMREGRPALFKFDPEKGKMIMQQQFIGWGTGGEMDKGGSVFESEFKSCLKNWKEGNYQYGIIPLFFNAYAKPGNTREHIENERRAYLAASGTKKEDEAKVQFHQAYPMTIDDMFIRKSRTLVPVHYCQQRLDDIYNRTPAVEYGYFEPIYDKSQPTPDLYFEFRVIGSRFIPTSGFEDINTTALVIHHPPYGEVWRYRYYQGTDPISSETGHSKMSSSIWDAYLETVASTVFYRERNYKKCFEQCLLQNLYYDQENKGGVKELIEKNTGTGYFEFQEQHGFKKKFTANAELPEYLHTPNSGLDWWGISNNVKTAGHFISKLQELLEAHGKAIDVPWLWEQLKTFIEKDLKNSQTHRQTRYQAADLRFDYDDAIFSILISYINRISHMRKEPINVKKETETKKASRRYMQNAQTGWRMKLCEVDSHGKILRIIKG